MAINKMFIGGLAYGLGLAGFGVMLAGAGHGTGLLLDAASAPLSFCGFMFPLIGPPLMWSIVWWLLSYSHKSPQRHIVIIVMLLHYLSVLFVPFFESYSEEAYLVKMFKLYPSIVILAGVLYLSGQVAIWIYWFRARTDSLS